ncbi:MAG: hypothetical protein COB62_02825 [Piscirickettsiaceae bacterium]|nr:MAG: hypothetical protein COB62_02825 [Piscirickettsiaceae bacterium]
MSSLLKKLASLTLSSLLFYSVCQATPPSIPNFKAEYLLKHNGIEIGHVKLTVKQTATNTYRLISATETSGLLAFIRDDDVIETSRFELYENRLRPLSYQYKEHLGDGEKNVILTFDWTTLNVANASKGHVWKLPISIGVLDKALMQIALMRDLNTADGVLSYQIADGGRLKNYVFTRLGTEEITIDDKLYNTIKLARKKDDKPLITYYWCAPELYNLPILLQRKKTYGTFEMRLIKASFAAKKTEPQ